MTPNQFYKRISRLWNTHQAAADAFGVTRACVGHWLNGRRRIPESIVKLLECIESNVAQKTT